MGQRNCFLSGLLPPLGYSAADLLAAHKCLLRRCESLMNQPTLDCRGGNVMVGHGGGYILGTEPTSYMLFHIGRRSIKSGSIHGPVSLCPGSNCYTRPTVTLRPETSPIGRSALVSGEQEGGDKCSALTAILHHSCDFRRAETRHLRDCGNPSHARAVARHPSPPFPALPDKSERRNCVRGRTNSDSSIKYGWQPSLLLLLTPLAVCDTAIQARQRSNG